MHAVGLYGAPAPASPSATASCDKVDIIQGTLAKAFGLIGGYIAASSGDRRFRAQLRAGLHLHHLAAAGDLRRRGRQHPPRQRRAAICARAIRSARRLLKRKLQRGRTCRSCRRRAISCRCWSAMRGSARRRRDALMERHAHLCAADQLSRPCRAAPSGCASRRRRSIPTPISTGWSRRSAMCGRACRSAASLRAPMFRDNSLIPTEAVPAGRAGLAGRGPRRYGDLAAEIRHFTSRIAGPSLDLMGSSLELLRLRGLSRARREAWRTMRCSRSRPAGATTLAALLQAHAARAARRLQPAGAAAEAALPHPRCRGAEQRAHRRQMALIAELAAKASLARSRRAALAALIRRAAPIAWPVSRHRRSVRSATLKMRRGCAPPPLRKVLAAGDEDLGAGHIGRVARAQIEDRRRDILGRAEPVQRDARDQHLGLGRQHRGLDLARRHRVDADAALRRTPPPSRASAPRAPPSRSNRPSRRKDARRGRRSR